MFDTAFIDSWQRCPWSLFTLSPSLALPCVVLPCPTLPCLPFFLLVHALSPSGNSTKALHQRTLHQAPPAFSGAWIHQGHLDGLPPDFVQFHPTHSTPQLQLRDCSPSQPPCCATAVSLHHNRLSASQPSLSYTTISLLHNHLSPTQPSLSYTTISLLHNHLSPTQPSLSYTTISLLHNSLSVTTHSPSHLTLSSQHTLSSQTPHHHTHSQPTPSS
jgi:hypothetical protein